MMNSYVPPTGPKNGRKAAIPSDCNTKALQHNEVQTTRSMHRANAKQPPEIHPRDVKPPNPRTQGPGRAPAIFHENIIQSSTQKRAQKVREMLGTRGNLCKFAG